MTYSAIQPDWGAPTGKPKRSSKRGRMWLLSGLGLVVVIALLASLVVVMPRLGWTLSPYGYDIVETATVTPSQPWTIDLPLNNPLHNSTANWREAIQVYLDPELKQPTSLVSMSLQQSFLTPKALITPKRLLVSPASDLLGVSAGLTLGSASLWPAGTYYVAQLKGMFGQTLDRPRVHVYTVAPTTGSLSGPSFSTSLTADGSPRFTWSNVDGAAAYYILAANPTPSASGVVERDYSVIGTAAPSQTSWTATDQEESFQNDRQYSQDITSYNSNFQAFTSSGTVCTAQDTRYNGMTPPTWDVTSLLYPAYAVVAVDKNGNTSLPQDQDGQSLVAATPIAIAKNTLAQMDSDAGSPSVFAPTTMPVTMGDCRTMFFPVTGQSLTLYHSTGTLSLTLATSGTRLTDTVTATGSADQSSLRSLAGQYGLREYMSYGLMEDLDYIPENQVAAYSQGMTPSTSAPDSPYTWNGSSDMVKYIAANLFAGATAIDLSQFTADPAAPLIYDATNEAFLQNPYITDLAPAIGIRDNVLYVLYEMSPQERAAAATRIYNEVTRVTAQIITPGMSDLDKAKAINKYLAIHAVYDNAALQFSLGNHTVQEYVDSFPNAWDAEGVLLDGTGVCASYTAAFKALADASGLVSEVITGYAGSTVTGHSWMKVWLGGKWQIVDPTWNSNVYEQIRGNVNTYFGLTDTQANRDPSDAFVVDSDIPSFDAN